MKKYKYLMLVFSFLLILTGCKTKDNKKIEESSNNTSISENGVESYRAKVSIRGTYKNNKVSENYIVLNNNNKSYEITFMDKEDISKIVVEKNKTIVYDKEEKEIDKKLNYDYTNTDLFLKGLNKTNTTKTSTEKIGEETYTIYNFNVTKDTMNEMLKPFNISVTEAGTGYAYIDSNNKVYLITYNTSDINISVSYTRLNSIK